jgi:protein involved in polysaccharide export with SLBB domain
MVRYFLILLVTVVVSGSFAQKQPVPDTAKQAPDSTVVANKDTTFFNPGEAIKISIYPDSMLFLNGFYHIDNNYNIDLPILGLVSLKDRSRTDFINLLKKEYSDYLRYPNINVTPYIRVSFFGGFYRPGLYWIEPRSTLWDAVQMAGGVAREDGLKKIRWERNGTIVSNNIITPFQTGTSLSNMGFRSGDQLCVTTKPKVVFWDVFRTDIMPVLSFTLSSAMTAMAAYQTYRLIQHDN